MGKLRPNCPLHGLVLPDGFLKGMLDSHLLDSKACLQAFSLSFFFFLLTAFVLFLPWNHGNDSCRIILMEGKRIEIEK